MRSAYRSPSISGYAHSTSSRGNSDTIPSPEEAAQRLGWTVDDGMLASLLGSLGPRERRVLTLRFGLDGREPETQAETARSMRARRSEIRRLEEYALRKLRLAPGVASLAAA